MSILNVSQAAAVNTIARAFLDPLPPARHPEPQTGQKPCKICLAPLGNSAAGRIAHLRAHVALGEAVEHKDRTGEEKFEATDRNSESELKRALCGLLKAAYGSLSAGYRPEDVDRLWRGRQ